MKATKPSTRRPFAAGSPPTWGAHFAHAERRIHGVQFHPEVVHTPRGAELLGNPKHVPAHAIHDALAQGAAGRPASSAARGNLFAVTG